MYMLHSYLDDLIPHSQNGRKRYGKLFKIEFSFKCKIWDWNSKLLAWWLSYMREYYYWCQVNASQWKLNFHRSQIYHSWCVCVLPISHFYQHNFKFIFASFYTWSLKSWDLYLGGSIFKILIFWTFMVVLLLSFF